MGPTSFEWNEHCTIFNNIHTHMCVITKKKPFFSSEWVSILEIKFYSRTFPGVQSLEWMTCRRLVCGRPLLLTCSVADLFVRGGWSLVAPTVPVLFHLGGRRCAITATMLSPGSITRTKLWTRVRTPHFGTHAWRWDALKVPGELAVIIVVTVIAIIVSHHGHYQWSISPRAPFSSALCLP